MTDPSSDQYWLSEFHITQADLERIATHIRDTGQAHDLTALARRVVGGRLRHGHETSAPAQPAWAADPSVRLWDPAGKWKVGDHVIVARRIPTTHIFEPLVGEIVAVVPGEVTVRLDRVEKPAMYRRAPRGSDEARKWHAKVQEVVAAKRRAPDLEERAEAIILTYGERIVSQLLDALRADERFLRLAGRWFLHELALPPAAPQLAALAWAMVGQDAPQPTEALAPLVQPPLAAGDPGLFGLYLGLRERSDLFENAEPGQRPRWVLAGPPPGSCTPAHAAYDPHTYAILCLPGQPIPPDMVRRLWDLGLLRAVLAQ